MGEVRAHVRLTNAIDETLARRGQAPPGGVRSIEADALIDTGSVRCVLPPQVVARLGLQIVGQREDARCHGRHLRTPESSLKRGALPPSACTTQGREVSGVCMAALLGFMVGTIQSGD